MTTTTIEKLMIRNGGPNIWTQDGTNFRYSESHPGEGWYPAVNYRRVHGYGYEAYSVTTKASDIWVKLANRALASEAQANFEKRR
jgi:hypothetical protein